jgi:hypothetical protein
VRLPDVGTVARDWVRDSSDVTALDCLSSTTSMSADDLLDRLPAKAAVHLQSADDFTAKHPAVVAVQAQGPARQRQGQQLAQERLEAFDHPQAGRNVAWLIRPAA